MDLERLQILKPLLRGIERLVRTRAVSIRLTPVCLRVLYEVVNYSLRCHQRKQDAQLKVVYF